MTQTQPSLKSQYGPPAQWCAAPPTHWRVLTLATLPPCVCVHEDDQHQPQQQQDGLVIIRMGIHNNTPATLCACTSFSRQQQRVE